MQSMISNRLNNMGRSLDTSIYRVLAGCPLFRPYARHAAGHFPDNRTLCHLQNPQCNDLQNDFRNPVPVISSSVQGIKAGMFTQNICQSNFWNILKTGSAYAGLPE